MGNEHAELAEFANNLWKNYIKPKFRQEYKDIMTFYRAEVTANNGDGTLNVQRPFDNVITVPCTEDMSTAGVHSQVTVLRFGNGNNSANQLVVAYGDGNPSFANLLRTVNTSTITDANSALRMTVADVSGSSVSNLPTTETGWLITLGRSSTRRLQYFAVATRTGNTVGDLYCRNNYNGTWSDWIRYCAQTLTTTWQTPTVMDTAITISSGGYYVEGKRVYVQMAFTLTEALAANTARQLASGMPPCVATPSAILNCVVYNRGGHAVRVTSGGILQIISDYDHAITAGQSVVITGVYTTA